MRTSSLTLAAAYDIVAKARTTNVDTMTFGKHPKMEKRTLGNAKKHTMKIAICIEKEGGTMLGR